MLSHIPYHVVGLVVVVLALAACSGPRTNDANIRTIHYEQLNEMLAEDDVLLLDPRTPEAYAAGHLPEAISISLPDLRPGDPRLTEAGTIVVYAGGWTDPLAIAAAKRLVVLGYDNVLHFPGGLELWTESGRRVERLSATPAGRPESTR